MNNSLLPCPFCGKWARAGHHNSRRKYNKYYLVMCAYCFARTVGDTVEEAIAAWNRRAQPENEPLTLDELRQMGGEPVYCVDADGSGAWALVHTQDEVCTDANYGDWEFYCYGWRDGGKMNENGWLAYRAKPERSEGK